MNVTDIMRRCQLRRVEKLPTGETVVVVRPMRFLPVTAPRPSGVPAHVNRKYLRSNPA